MQSSDAVMPYKLQILVINPKVRYWPLGGHCFRQRYQTPSVGWDPRTGQGHDQRRVDLIP